MMGNDINWTGGLQKRRNKEGGVEDEVSSIEEAKVQKKLVKEGKIVVENPKFITEARRRERERERLRKASTSTSTPVVKEKKKFSFFPNPRLRRGDSEAHTAAGTGTGAGRL